MATHIAEHFAEELSAWRGTMDHYQQEMDEIGTKLTDIIRRNSIKDIAEKVEMHQDLLDAVADDFDMIQVAISHQEEALMVNDHYIADEMVREETENRQQDIRKRMLDAEKAFIDAKYQCREFIARTLT
jgi:hypothetical protein